MKDRSRQQTIAEQLSERGPSIAAQSSVTQRVAITGIGAITPIGTGVEAIWTGVRSGKSAITAITRFDASHFASRVAGEIDFDPLDYMPPRQARRLDRFSQFALICARMALEDAGLTAADAAGDGAGIYIGSALGGVAFAEEQHTSYVLNGPHHVNPLLALSVFGGAASSNVTIELGLTGPSLANGNSCASGLIAIGEAARLIEDGRIPIMLAGGAEGGCVLVLESFDHAAVRGARIYAELSGYGTTSDAHHMTAPRPDGVQAARAMSNAIRGAGLPPGAIDYVNAHGSSTVLNDSTECRAIRIALGKQADRVAVSGTKGLHGHALGATGAMETAICALTLERGHLPGTANLVSLDPACDLDVIPPGGRERQISHLLCNAFGFGGINASLALSAV